MASWVPNNELSDGTKLMGPLRTEPDQGLAPNVSIIAGGVKFWWCYSSSDSLSEMQISELHQLTENITTE